MRATRLAAAVAAFLGCAAASVGYGPAYGEACEPDRNLCADDVRDGQWHLDELRVGEAHRHSLGERVTVAVLDTGVDASHPDLRDNVLPGADLTGQGSDGRVDPGGSGTALAGLVAGHGHSGLAVEDEEAGPSVAPDGVLGVAPRAKILPVVVAAPGSSPAAGTLAAGIDEAVWRGADVICIGRPVPDDPAVAEALGAAVAAGVVVVVPGVPRGSDVLARFQGAGLLGAVPSGTSGGSGSVAVPAAGVMSAGGQGGYFRYARTADAAATAVLAGAAALVRAAHPELAGYEVAHRISATADGGALALVDALTARVAAPPAPPAGLPGSEEPEPPGPSPTTPSPEPEPVARVAAFDSDDWRRWLVAVPLVVFLGALTAASVTAARRARR